MWLLQKFLVILSAMSDIMMKLYKIVHGFRGALTLTFLGIAGILSGLFICFVNPYDLLYKWKCTFSEGGEIFELWHTPPVDLYLRVFLWNVTNRDEYMSGKDDKLKMVEVGPYVYKELMSHENVTFNDNGTLTAVPKHPLVWVPELSEGRREDDLLVLPNIALLSITHVVAEENSYFTKLGLNMLISNLNEQPLVQMTAKEFMFGYESSLMTLGNSFMPSWIYFEKLGLIDRMYEFGGDYETIFTGEGDLSKAGLIDTYRGSHKIPQWESPCGDISGSSDGTKFPGDIKPDDELLFFRKSLCRAKKLTKINETVSHGLQTYVYTFVNNTDDNGHLNPETSCFCEKKDNCLPNGLLDVHGCYYGFPIALSYPHFLDADPIVNERVMGNNPSSEKHRTFIMINPKAGLPTELAVRYQINMALGNIADMTNVDRFSEMVLPLLWTEIRLYGLPDYLAARFRIYINVLPIVEQGLMYCFYVTGVAFLLYAVFTFRTVKTKKTVFNAPWIEEELALNIDRKLSSYMPEKRTDMSPKELEVYYNSLVTPLNQQLESQENALHEIEIQ